MSKKDKKKKQYDDDDGRVISDMNVDGMPWYVEQYKKNEEKKRELPENEKIQLTPEEEKAMRGGILKATLLVASVFLLAFLLFILFCVFVWFK